MKNATQTITNERGKTVIVKPYRKAVARKTVSADVKKAEVKATPVVAEVPVAPVPAPAPVPVAPVAVEPAPAPAPVVTKPYVPRKSRKTGRGRTGLTGMALVIPGLRTILEDKEISPYYRKKLAERGFIGLRLEKEPGTMGRPKIVAVLTSKGLKYWEQHSDKVPGYLLANAA